MEASKTQEGSKFSKGLIDVEDALRRKLGKNYRFVPSRVVRYLKRITHQERVNKFVSAHGGLKDFEFLDKVLHEGFKVKIQINNLDYLPERGGCVVVGNHPLGGMDGMAVFHAIGKKRRDVKSISNDLLMNFEPLRDLFIPVNPFGRNTPQNVKLIEDNFASDNCLLIFPAGLVSRKQKGGVIKDLEWKKTFITKSVKHNRLVVPVHVSGHNSKFFYNLARWRKRLGVKFNIEMLFLIDEMFRQEGNKLEITFGEPIPPSTFTDRFTHGQWAGKVKEHVYGLPKGNIVFNP